MTHPMCWRGSLPPLPWNQSIYCVFVGPNWRALFLAEASILVKSQHKRASAEWLAS
jgi:hypothetical protein